MKECRWYDIENGMLCVYSHPIKANALFMSITKLEDMKYYRNTFKLRKVWE